MRKYFILTLEIAAWAALVAVFMVMNGQVKSSPVPPPKKSKKAEVKEPSAAQAAKRHPAIFVGAWDMGWGVGVTFKTVFAADGTYSAVNESGGWEGTWWVEADNRLWVDEVSTHKQIATKYKWGILFNASLSGDIDRGSLLDTKVTLTKRKPDA